MQMFLYKKTHKFINKKRINLFRKPSNCHIIFKHHNRFEKIMLIHGKWIEFRFQMGEILCKCEIISLISYRYKIEKYKYWFVCVESLCSNFSFFFRHNYHYHHHHSNEYGIAFNGFRIDILLFLISIHSLFLSLCYVKYSMNKFDRMILDWFLAFFFHDKGFPFLLRSIGFPCFSVFFLCSWIKWIM